jgi:dehydratase ilvD1
VHHFNVLKASNARLASGKTLGVSVAGAKCYNREVTHTLVQPANPISGIWVLSGNLCPQGAVMKPSAADPWLFTHRGRAVVFHSIEDLPERIDSPGLVVDENSVLVMQGCGPRGYPGMPEVGNMPLPQKLLEKVIKDMVRISDARMSGTAFGTVVLHVAPESDVGGPLALVQDGDEIALDGPRRRLELLISAEELAVRWAALSGRPQSAKYVRCYYSLYVKHVMQADRGCDLDFLVGASGGTVERESH